MQVGETMSKGGSLSARKTRSKSGFSYEGSRLWSSTGSEGRPFGGCHHGPRHRGPRCGRRKTSEQMHRGRSNEPVRSAWSASLLSRFSLCDTAGRPLATRLTSSAARRATHARILMGFWICGGLYGQRNVFPHAAEEFLGFEGDSLSTSSACTSIQGRAIGCSRECARRSSRQDRNREGRRRIRDGGFARFSQS